MVIFNKLICVLDGLFSAFSGQLKLELGGQFDHLFQLIPQESIS
jgi:hypothetical protein